MGQAVAACIAGLIKLSRTISPEGCSWLFDDNIILYRKMDPLTAVSLAGTVVQFVDFTCKLISAGGQLYEAKELESSRVAKASAERIRLLATSSITNLQNYRLKLQAKLSTDGGDITLTRDDSLLEDICRKCTAEAEVLIARLQKLEVPIDAKHRGWQSLEMALRSVSSQKEIERMNQKLVDYRAQISSQIIVSLRYVQIKGHA